MDLSYPGFFDRAPNVLVPLGRRNLIFDCTCHVQKYLLFMEIYLFDHNLTNRAEQMNSDARNDEAAIAYDRDFTRGLLAADDHCKSRDMSSQISRLQELLPSPVAISQDLSEFRTSLRLAQKQCRQVVRKARDLALSYQDERIRAKQLANPDVDPEHIAKTVKQRD